MVSLDGLPLEMMAEVFKNPPPFVAPALKATCHRTNDAFHSFHTAIRAEWVGKYLGVQTTSATPNPDALERKAIIRSLPEILPDLILSMVNRSNAAFVDDPPITVMKSDLLALEQAIKDYGGSSQLLDFCLGKMYSFRVYLHVTKALKAVEMVIMRNLGPVTVCFATCSLPISLSAEIANEYSATALCRCTRNPRECNLWWIALGIPDAEWERESRDT